MTILIRGGGDLASGVAIRLYRAGMRVAITELSKPLAVRRLVSFAEAVYEGEVAVEGVLGRRIADFRDKHGIWDILEEGIIPVIIDADAESTQILTPPILIDARMKKKPPEKLDYHANLVIGLGPGFEAGKNCHAVIETNRGHCLGRVIWNGKPLADTGIPESVGAQRENRVLKAPVDGRLKVFARICSIIEKDQKIAEVGDFPIVAGFKGVLRGILHNEFPVKKGQKVGDLDPRCEPQYCSLVSDKALAVGGGVLEAILSKQEVRNAVWR